MKKVLITGANSYIGTSFESYILSNFSNDYQIDTLDMIGGSWKTFDFSKYDSVFHVAGIAHSDSGKISAEKEKLYRSVNTELTISVAQKAKEAGVKQFIFMSSAIVYGDSAPVGKSKVITKDTIPCPSNCYGDSKLQAENGIIPMSCDAFHVVVLRPPMIYGKGCKGNFPILEKIANSVPVFPKINNERSMLFIGNLVEFVRLLIENNEEGIFWPCNRESLSTSSIVRKIAFQNNKHIILIPGLSFAFRILSIFFKVLNKAFGNLTYSEELIDSKYDYRNFTFDESIKSLR